MNEYTILENLFNTWGTEAGVWMTEDVKKKIFSCFSSFNFFLLINNKNKHAIKYMRSLAGDKQTLW